jgi:hypothetical protein
MQNHASRSADRRSGTDRPTFSDVVDVSGEDTDDVYHAAATMPPPADAPPGPLAERAAGQLAELSSRFRADAERTRDPRVHALLRCSAEVLTGLARAFNDAPDPSSGPRT